MIPYLKENYGNPGSLHDMGRKSACAVASARENVASLINAEPNQIIFTSGGSEANNMVFSGTKDYLIRNGKTHIITTPIEHDSILRTVSEIYNDHYSREDESQLFKVQYVRPRRYSSVRSNAVIKKIKKDLLTGLVSVMHTNNETGISNHISKVGLYCEQNGVLFHTDCVQSASCRLIDVKELHCDYLSLSSHKIHGPKGVGALYVRDKRTLSPIIYGGSEQEFGLRGGTENVASIVGFGMACKILKRDRFEDFQYISRLKRLLYIKIKNQMHDAGLGERIHINGKVDLSDYGKIINLSFDGVDAETLLMMLDARGICVSAGSACTSRESEPSHVLLAMGIDAERARSSLRFSVSKMNTVEEIEKASKIIVDCVKLLLKVR